MLSSFRTQADVCARSVAPVEVGVDIKPGSDPNAINPLGGGGIPVGTGVNLADFR